MTQLTRRQFLSRTSAGAAIVALHPFSAHAAANQAHLRIMETTDVHMHIFPYDYYGDRPVDTVGLSRTASIMADIRAEATNTFLVDNGDFLQGNPMGDYMAYERGLKEGDSHPIITAMNTLGYDAATIGNHEFNYGLSFLDKATARAEFPFVLSNVAKKVAGDIRSNETLFAPYSILDRELTDGAGNTHPIKIGVIGFTPPQIMIWDRRHLEGNVEALDMVACAEAYVPEMKEKGADVIIALAHSGFGNHEHVDMSADSAIPLAGVDGIDAIVTGHSHKVFPSPDYEDRPGMDVAAGTVMGKPAVMGGYWGSDLGLIDLLLERDGNEWRVITTTSEARKIYVRGEDRKINALVEDAPAILAAVQNDHDETLKYIRRAVGKTQAPLHSYFALVADDPSVQIVSIAQMWYVKQQLAGSEYADLPLLSAAAPFKAGYGSPENYTDVAVGDVAIKNVADLYLYPNTVRAVKITGSQLKGWLERSAGMFNQITPGATDVPLLNPNFPTYNFDVMDGVTYQIDLSKPMMFDRSGAVIHADTQRIVNLQYQGAPVTDDMEFIVATNNYRASGGGAFPGAKGDTIIFEGPDTNRDVIVRYIVEEGPINPKADANWSFAPMADTSVIFTTGPAGVGYASDVEGVSIEDTNTLDENGYAKLRIAL